MVSYLIVANSLMIGTLIFKFNSLPPQIPLFYSKSWGEDQLADTWMIILLPILMNIFIIFNNYLYKKFFNGNQFVKKIIYFFNLFVIICFTFIFIRIIFLIS